jgi:hypothetical protein
MRHELDGIQRLLAIGRARGWLTAAEVMNGLPLDRMTIGGLAEAAGALEDAGISIREGGSDDRRH